MQAQRNAILGRLSRIERVSPTCWCGRAKKRDHSEMIALGRQALQYFVALSRGKQELGDHKQVIAEHVAFALLVKEHIERRRVETLALAQLVHPHHQ